MSHDSAFASAADGIRRPDALDSPNPRSTRDDDDGDDGDASTGESRLAMAMERLCIQAKKRSEFLQDVIVNLDILIYAELCILYYMDCSFLRLAVRALAQITFLTPKPPNLPPMPEHRPYLWAIFGTNLFCAVLHIFTARPQAGELARGYVHGGMIMDFIGYKGPTSKTSLLALDVLVTALQSFMLTVHCEREKIKRSLEQSPPGAGINRTQDHDAEERGVLRGLMSRPDDIELQGLGIRAEPSASRNGSMSGNNADREALLADLPETMAESEGGPLDIFYSGTVVIAEFHVIDTLRSQVVDYASVNNDSLGTSAAWAMLSSPDLSRRIADFRG